MCKCIHDGDWQWEEWLGKGGGSKQLQLGRRGGSLWCVQRGCGEQTHQIMGMMVQCNLQSWVMKLHIKLLRRALLMQSTTSRICTFPHFHFRLSCGGVSTKSFGCNLCCVLQQMRIGFVSKLGFTGEFQP